jgi:hypothetical protein
MNPMRLLVTGGSAVISVTSRARRSISQQVRYLRPKDFVLDQIMLFGRSASTAYRNSRRFGGA